MLKEKKEPKRLCVACKEKNLKKNLIRIAKNKDGSVCIDIYKKAQGRGAYLCFNLKCFEFLKKKKMLERSLKCVIDKKIYFEIENIINNV